MVGYHTRTTGNLTFGQKGTSINANIILKFCNIFNMAVNKTTASCLDGNDRKSNLNDNFGIDTFPHIRMPETQDYVHSLR